MKLISRQSAISQGLTRYYTGKLCRNNHRSIRAVKRNLCIECKRQQDLKYKNKHLEILRAKWRIRSKFYREANVEIRNSQNAVRRARRRQACPIWVDRKELNTVYKNCPKGYQVDHIVPLAGKNVCGLHVPWNLQYLTPEQNIQKYNHF